MSLLTLADLEAFDRYAPDRGRERRFCCPLCGVGKPIDAAHRSISLNAETGVWRCHRCHASGGPRDAGARPSARRSRQSAVVARAFALPEPPQADTGDWEQRLAAAVPIAGTPGERYLATRGISVQLAQAAGVCYLCNFYGRPAVLFPLRAREGQPVGAQGRYIDSCTPKVRDAGRKSLGCFVTAGALDADPLVIAEAPIDALSLAACGYPAIATLGCDLPDWLAWHCASRRVMIATDADDAGDRAASEWATRLRSRGARVLRLRPSEGQDWNEMLVADGRALHDQIHRALAHRPDSEAASLQSAIDATGNAMQALAVIPDDEWLATRDALLAGLDVVDGKLRDRGETYANYGWSLDAACGWQKVGEEPAPPPEADWSEFSAVELIQITESFGARLRVEGGRLRAENAADVPASLRMAIRERQAEVAEAVMVGGACS